MNKDNQIVALLLLAAICAGVWVSAGPQLKEWRGDLYTYDRSKAGVDHEGNLHMTGFGTGKYFTEAGLRVNGIKVLGDE
jgi:hypothetical protein